MCWILFFGLEAQERTRYTIPALVRILLFCVGETRDMQIQTPMSSKESGVKGRQRGMIWRK